MNLKKNEFFLLIFLILLQSCSGGSIGNFLESSFIDLEEISQDRYSQKNLENKEFVQEDKLLNEKNYENIKEIEKSKSVKENNEDTNLEKIQKQKDNKIKNSSKKRKNELQSYKIILILKDVDPKDPTKKLSIILMDSEVNFEIEKIERILDSKNKSMNKN